MSKFNFYAICGIKIETDLDEAKALLLANLKSAGHGPIYENSLHFDFKAVGYVDIFPEHMEVRIEVQAEDLRGFEKAKDIMLGEFASTFERSVEELEWQDITQKVLADRSAPPTNQTAGEE